MVVNQPPPKQLIGMPAGQKHHSGSIGHRRLPLGTASGPGRMGGRLIGGEHADRVGQVRV